MQHRFLQLIGKHNKTATVIIVMMLIVAAYVYRSHTHSSLADNLYAGAIEVGIVVLFIQAILNVEHRYRLGLVNAHTAENIRLMTATSIFRTLRDTGLKDEVTIDTVQSITNEELRKIYEQHITSEEYKNYLTGLSIKSNATRSSLNSLVKSLEDWSRGIDEGLRDVRPYPRPELIAISTEMSARSTAMKYAVDELYTKIVKGVVKNYKKGSKNYKNAESLTDWVWRDFIIGSKDTEHGFSNMLTSILGKCLAVHKAAQNNSLYIDL